MSTSLHLFVDSGQIHMELPPESDPDEVLATCQDNMRAGRVAELPGALPPGAIRRTTVLVNFKQVSVAWVDRESS